MVQSLNWRYRWLRVATFAAPPALTDRAGTATARDVRGLGPPTTMERPHLYGRVCLSLLSLVAV